MGWNLFRQLSVVLRAGLAWVICGTQVAEGEGVFDSVTNRVPTMTGNRERYARLERMDVQTEAIVAVAAAGYFSPLAIGERKRRDGESNRDLTPARSADFVDFLEKKGVLPNAQKYIYQIRDLLARMEQDNILVSFPSYTGNVMLPKSYYALHELSEARRRGLLWLAKTLGGRFVHAQVSPAVVHIVGEDDSGEGSGVVFDSRHVLTCRHVVTDMTVAAKQGFQGREVGVDDIVQHPDVDVAVIKTTEPLSPVAGLAFLRPEVSQKVYRFGYARVPCSIPLDAGEPTIETGEVTRASVTVFGGVELFLYSAVSRPGDSGGAIVSEEGYVVGMTTELSDARFARRDGEDVFSPHYAGVPSHVIAQAVEELDLGVRIPYETFD